jgi:hypothetical protein
MIILVYDAELKENVLKDILTFVKFINIHVAANKISSKKLIKT